MKNHDIAKLVNDLTAIAKQYGQTEQLRDRVADAVLGLTAEVNFTLTCDDCGIATENPWHDSVGNNRHWHRCDPCQKLYLYTASTIKWISTDEAKPELSEDVIVTILIDGIDTDWRAGFWDGQHWYTLDTEIDEPIQVNAGCNFFVTHWARVTPAEVVA